MAGSDSAPQPHRPGHAARQLPYSDWNNVIASQCFQREMAGRPVYLYVTEDLIKELSARFETSPDDFVRAVKAGPPGTSGMGLCQKALHLYTEWRKDRFGTYPPYVAYLALFVLAGGREGDFAANAYSPRLWDLLAERGRTGTPPSFHLMLDLWDDLERWSNRDKRGSLGIFTAQIAGGWIHVGMPLAQTLLSESEREALLGVFAAAGLDPTSQPSDSELTQLLWQHGVHCFRPRTRNLLKRPHDEDELHVHEVLLDIIRGELANWDGSLAERAIEPAQRPIEKGEEQGRTELPEPETVGPKRKYGTLRICAQLDSVAGKLQAYFRCRTNQPLPEDGVVLRVSGASGALYCEEYIEGWSTPLEYLRTGLRADASAFDWSNQLELADQESGWHMRLNGRPVRIFVHGDTERLPHLVEVNQLNPRTLFYMAVEKSHVPDIVNWGQKGCEAFKEISIALGLPEGWAFFTSKSAFSDEAIKERYPFLAFSETLSLRLVGGLHSSRGSTYFDFGLPQIALEGGEGTEKISCRIRETEIELEPNPETNSFALPPGLESGTEVTLVAWRVVNGTRDDIRRRAVYIENDFDWKGRKAQQLFDRFGKAIIGPPAILGIAGAYLTQSVLPGCCFELPAELFEASQIVFVGPVPGQIVFWPKEPLPHEWQPVWAVKLRKDRGQALFCGSAPVPPSAMMKGMPPKKLREWKEVLYHWRKRIASPPQSSLRALWRQYQEAAQNAR